MALERNVTRVTLTPTDKLDQQCSWLLATWERADGSSGHAQVGMRLEKAEAWYVARVLVDVDKLREVPVARIAAAANADVAARAWLADDYSEAIMAEARAATHDRPRLSRPTGGRLDDEFYRSVAAAYRGAAANGLSPAKTLADESGAPQGSVNRWIAEARRRGFLGAAVPGKVTV